MKKILCALSVAMLMFGSTACSKPSVTAQEPVHPTAVTKPTEQETAATELTGVHPEETSASTSPLVSYSVYIPNDNADGFDVEIIRTEKISVETVLAELVQRNVLPNTVSANQFHIDNGLITIDFNQAFADIVCSMGTSGELMIVGSVVNTFLDAFQAEYVYFTVNGQILESGHTIYDFSMPFFSVNW